MEPHIRLFVSTCPLSNYGAKLIIGFDDPDLDRYTVQDWASLTLMIYNSLVPLVLTYLQKEQKGIHFPMNVSRDPAPASDWPAGVTCPPASPLVGPAGCCR